MKILFNGDFLTLCREDSDPKFYGVQNAAGESKLFHFLKTELNSHGFHLIKKRMWKDGHLVDDMQQYLRTDKKRPGVPQIYIWNNKWAIRGAEEDWNDGKVVLSVMYDINSTNLTPESNELEHRELVKQLLSS